MYISLKDSCANGFRKWADAHQPEMKNDLRASGSRLVSASPDQDSPVLTHSSDRIIHGSCRARGRYKANSADPPGPSRLQSPER
jgi:hypothetical protein